MVKKTEVSEQVESTPTGGGSFLRNEDGTLVQVEGTDIEKAFAATTAAPQDESVTKE